jgi:DNA ligase-1
MKRFADLYAAIDATTSTRDKTAAMVDYFKRTSARDAAWAAWFLTGNRPRQAVPTKRLHVWATEAAGLPLWLFEESYDAVGDLAETISLVLPESVHASEAPLHEWIEERLLPLRDCPEVEQKARLLAAWSELGTNERFVFTKLITGAFRVGVSQLLVTRAISMATGVDAKVVAHRLMGDWQPTQEAWAALVDTADGAADRSKPYPFFLAHPLEADPRSLGERAEWIVEWKWDGIRAQLLRREGESALWSRGDETIAHQFPELIDESARLPDVVLDGEVLAWKDGHVMPFAALQKRLGRKNPGKKVMADSPVVFLAFDLLEVGGEDWRARPLAERRAKLEVILAPTPGLERIFVVPSLDAPQWEGLAALRGQSRAQGTEGLMHKRRDSAYGVGRPRGDWWKWKIEPYTLDAVLIYAQSGHGKRAGLYTDYTFGLWKGGELVPFAKAYSGLSDAEIREVDAFIRKNTLEKFGPVRTVRPELVFELAFEGIQRSARHKSGIAVRFPRMLRIRADKPVDQADTLDTALALVANATPGSFAKTLPGP